MTIAELQKQFPQIGEWKESHDSFEGFMIHTRVRVRKTQYGEWWVADYRYGGMLNLLEVTGAMQPSPELAVADLVEQIHKRAQAMASSIALDVK